MLDILQNAGLLRNEAKVYLTLLETSTATATEISKRVEIHRPNVYEAIQGLINKGLIMYREGDGGRVYEAADPNILLNLLRDKERELENILPSLLLKKQLVKQDTHHAYVYEGVQSIHNILSGFIELGQPILAYGIPKEAPIRLKSFIEGFHKRRIDKGILMRHIYNHNVQDRIIQLNTMPCTEARFLPPRFDSPISTNICGNQVVLIHWTSTPMVIQFVNDEIAAVYKNYFDMLWSAAKLPEVGIAPSSRT